MIITKEQYSALPKHLQSHFESLEHNPHVCVKPIKLMRYLVRLITPFGGVVVDPFLGVGSTAIAAEMEGFQWVGCDNNKDYCDIARARIHAARKQARAK